MQGDKLRSAHAALVDLARSQLFAAIEAARAADIDVDTILIDELRDAGFNVHRSEVDWPGPDEYEPEL